MKAVVVGGGVVGLACAHALLDVADAVEVLDAGAFGHGASAGNAGWVTPTLATPLASPGILATGLRSALDPRGALVIRPRLDPSWVGWLWRFARSSRRATFERGVAALQGLTLRTLDELDRLAADGVAFEEHRAGLLAVARDRAGMHWFDELFAVLRATGFPGTIDQLDGAAARALEPALGDAVGRATRTSLDRHVAPESLCAGLATRLAERGATLAGGVRATAVLRHRDGLAVVTDDGERRADLVVLATALGTPALVAPYGLRLPLVGAKGYSVTVDVPAPSPALPLYLCEPKIGTSPLAGRTRLAGFFELGSTDGSPSRARAAQLVEETAPYLRAPLAPLAPDDDGWAGFRHALPDSLPVIGAVPGVPGLLLATGHGMLGVTLAPVTGRAVAHLARGERPAWLAPFDPARFA